MNKKIKFDNSLNEFLLIKDDIRLILNKVYDIDDDKRSLSRDEGLPLSSTNKSYINTLINKLNDIDIFNDNKYFILNDILYGLISYLYYNNYNIYYFLCNNN